MRKISDTQTQVHAGTSEEEECKHGSSHGTTLPTTSLSKVHLPSLFNTVPYLHILTFLAMAPTVQLCKFQLFFHLSAQFMSG